MPRVDENRWTRTLRGVRAFSPPRWLEPLVLAACCAPLVYFAIALWSDLAHGTRLLGSNPITEAEHETGEWTLRFLMFTLGVTPVLRLLRWGWIVRYRRTFGLFAFAYAIVHLSVYAVLDVGLDWSDVMHDVMKHPYITVGVAALLLMVPLALTSTKRMIRRLGGRRWNALHRLVWATVVLGILHFMWGVKKDIEDPLVFASIFAALYAFRVWSWLAQRARRARRTSDERRDSTLAARHSAA
jgi:methionine sulfoxide reductase heme-binding subunit